MRVAFFSPLPPERSGIADYSYELLEELRHHLDVVAVVRDDLVGTDRAPEGVPVVGLSAMREEDVDCSVYQMGNNPKYHRFFFQRALEQPGLLVMHDPSLADFHAEMCRKADSGVFRAEIAYDTPDVTVEARLPLIEVAPGEFNLDRLRVLLARRIVESNIRTLVHSTAMAAELRRRYPGADVATIQLPAQLLPPSPAVPPRVAGEITFGVFGGINFYKRIDAVVGAFQALHRDYPRARLVVAGRPDDRDMAARLHVLARDPRLRGRLVVKTHLSLAELEAEMVACDVAISLRWPTAGEMSATLMRTFGAGKPAVVTDVLQFRELDERFCWRVPVEPELEAPALFEVMRRCAASPEDAAQAGELARQFVAREATYKVVSEHYVEHVRYCSPRRRGWAAAILPFSKAANSVLGVNLLSAAPQRTDDAAATEGARQLLAAAAVDVLDRAVPNTAISGVWPGEPGYRSPTALTPDEPARSLVEGLGASRASGADARRLARALAPQGRARRARRVVDALHDIDLCFAGTREAGRLSQVARDDHLRGRRVVAALSLDVFPLGPRFAGLFDHADEVWVPSSFSADIARGHTDAPVVVVPWPALAVPRLLAQRSPGLLPTFSGATFLVVADGHRGLARGNPWAAIAAFQRAFGPSERGSKARLVVAARNVSSGEARARLTSELSLVGGCLLEEPSDADLVGLVDAADVLVSLHRTESFGSWSALAMAMGKPVVATAYGGNLDFMSPRSACLVGYELVPVMSGDYYLDDIEVADHDWDQYWARPHLAQAEGWMRRLLSASSRAQLGQIAREAFAAQFDQDRVVRTVRERLARLVHDSPRDRIVRYLASQEGLSRVPVAAGRIPMASR